MGLKTTRIEESQSSEYEELVRKSREGMLTHSWKFAKLIGRAIPGTEAAYMGAFSGGRIVAAIPAILKAGSGLKVLNSLPLSGSPGGCVTDPSLSGAQLAEARESLLKGLASLASEQGCLTATVVTSPFDSSQGYYDKMWPADHTEERVAQVLDLPEKQEDLLARFSKKCKYAIRQAEKAGMTTEVDTSPSNLNEIKGGHIEQLSRLGATPKPAAIFENIPWVFRADEDYRIYRASVGGESAAFVLAFYFKDIVEYFTPVTYAVFKAYSPMNLIVYQLARDAIGSGYRRLNFGGTRRSQPNLYRFKRSFGCSDHLYWYRVRKLSLVARRGQGRGITKEEIESLFPSFYVYPFDRLGELS